MQVERTRLSILLIGSLLLAACGPSTSAGDCPECDPGQICVDGQCVDATDGGVNDGGPDGFVWPDAGCPNVQCGAMCCRPGEFCALGEACAVEQEPCTTSDDCWYDSYCDNGTCIPYGIPAGHDHDETCENPIDIAAILPAEQCRWTGPPAGDAHPDHHHVMSTPVVIDFDFDADPYSLHPSIVFTSFPPAGHYQSPGVIRVIDGNDCTQQFSFDAVADQAMSPAPVAVADLTGDGRAEIVAATYNGGLMAFGYDPANQTFTQLWRSGACVGSGPPTTPDYTGATDKWSGPSIHDLDNDGDPEIIYGATVYRSDGCLVSDSLGFPAYHKGVIPVIVDVDADNQMELVLGNGIYTWSTALQDWVPETYWNGAGLDHGQVAVADFGDWPLASQGGQDRAEVVVVSSGYVRVQTIEGTIIFGPLPIPGGGTGGAPTVADFDGDGRREFATAGGSQYVVFDFDCLTGGDPAGCNGQSLTTGILWAQPCQDQSSNTTGSSVFDFDADGAAEAVYADECYLRIYDGASGQVLYSAARSSGTTYENPVIVDVDGDYRTEIVSAVNNYATSLVCPATDPLMPSSSYQQNHGIVVLRDVEDRWAASRPVWNQHAYSVTHIGDQGQIQPSTLVPRNWEDPVLNNFRQNVQGSLTALGEPDLTAGGDVGTVACTGTVATISARVCNRGTLPMVDGTEVAFYEGGLAGPELCRATIPVALTVGECMVVSCEADLAGQVIDVFVMVDPDSATAECYEANNGALYQGVACGNIPF